MCSDGAQFVQGEQDPAAVSTAARRVMSALLGGNLVQLGLDFGQVRVTEGFRELSNKIDALNRSRLQTEADYIGLLQRVTDLESKAS